MILTLVSLAQSERDQCRTHFPRCAFQTHHRSPTADNVYTPEAASRGRPRKELSQHVAGHQQGHTDGGELVLERLRQIASQVDRLEVFTQVDRRDRLRTVFDERPVC
jgi:hypothetical protein